MIIISLFDQKNGFQVFIPNLAKKTNVYRKNKVADNAVYLYFIYGPQDKCV